MTKKARYNSTAFNDFKSYSNNKMSESERNAFEKELEKNPFLKDAYEGYVSISNSDFEKDVNNLGFQISQRTKKSRSTLYFRIAASLTLVIALTSFLYLFLNPKISEEINSSNLSESTDLKEEMAAEPKIIDQPAIETELIKPKQKKTIPAVTYNNNIETTTKDSDAEILNTAAGSLESTKVNAELETEQAMEISEVTKMPDVMSEKPTPSAAYSSATIEMKESYDEQKRLRGKVRSSDDYQPVVGATVSVKGSKKATVTNAEGEFELPAEGNTDTSTTLQIDFIGMERQEILADAGNDVNIVLNPSTNSLDEVVVVNKSGKRKSTAKTDTQTLEIPEAIPLNGKKDFEKYVSDNQQFPANNEGINSAKIVLVFNVNADNRAYNIKVLESPGKIYSDEAIRLLELSPGWLFSPDNLSPVKTVIILTSL